MIVRVLTAVMGAPLLLWFIYLGGLPFLGAVELVSAVMLWEYAKLAEGRGVPVHRLVLLVAGLALPALSYVGMGGLSGALMFAAVALELGVRLAQGPEQNTLEASAATVFGAIYIGFPLSLAVTLRSGRMVMLIVAFLIIWADDIMAFLIGVRFGRHRLLPAVSPKKSVEGAIAGLLGGALTLWFVRSWVGLEPLSAVGVGFLVAAAGQVGDLAESLLKRYANVKDAGNILPGHGGFLDRFDSALFAIPCFYLLIRLVT